MGGFPRINQRRLMYTAKERRKEISRISLSVEGIPPLLGRYEYLIKDEMFTSYES